jgi:hypothetical protein
MSLILGSGYVREFSIALSPILILTNSPTVAGCEVYGWRLLRRPCLLTASTACNADLMKVVWMLFSLWLKRPFFSSKTHAGAPF